MEYENYKKEIDPSLKGKEGKACGFRSDNKCNSGCGLYCQGLKMCVLHSINLHIKELETTVDKRLDRANMLLSFIEKKMEKLK